MNTNYTLVLLSGGTGSRMHNSVPKQYMLLAGKPIIMHILERVDQIESIEKIVIVCADEYVQSVDFMLKQYGIKKRIQYAPAGSTRQASVLSGLTRVETENVIIHEAARPFVKIEDFESLINEENPNAMFGLPIPFTVVKGHDYVEGQLDRSELVNVQLPQKFQTEILRSAHEQALKGQKSFTEDASMIFNYKPDVKIKICAGLEYNIKITTRMDILIGEQIYDDEFRKRK